MPSSWSTYRLPWLFVVMLLVVFLAQSSDVTAQVGNPDAYGSAASAPNNVLYVDDASNVGINTTAPRAQVDIVAPSNVVVARFGATNNNAVRIGIASNAGAVISFIAEDGKMTGSGVSAFHNAIVYDRPNGLFHIRTGNENRLTINQAGQVSVPTLEIRGGADVAEPFTISGEGTIAPGMVVAIDPEQPGQLRVADSAYDPLVAGVISGAGDYQPGLILSQGEIGGDTHPVALTGRVYVKAIGPVQVGDLLTSSGIPGHAMSVADRDRAFGTTIGKAMSALDEETGLVLVLVALQ